MGLSAKKIMQETKKSITKNKKLWENLHKNPRFLPRYPHERVIQFIFSNFPRGDAHKYKIFDHGSGAGRHTIFLAENGYQTYGADVSKIGNRFTRKIAKRNKLKIQIQLITSDKLDYPDSCFDGIVSYGVLLYLNNDQLEVTIPELYRILKKGGKMLVMVRSSKDYRVKYAKDLSNGDYIIVGDRKTRVNNERKMLMHFFTRREIKRRFNMFKNIVINEMINTYNDGAMTDHDYIVELTK